MFDLTVCRGVFVNLYLFCWEAPVSQSSLEISEQILALIDVFGLLIKPIFDALSDLFNCGASSAVLLLSTLERPYAKARLVFHGRLHPLHLLLLLLKSFLAAASEQGLRVGPGPILRQVRVTEQT